MGFIPIPSFRLLDIELLASLIFNKKYCDKGVKWKEQKAKIKKKQLSFILMSFLCLSELVRD